MLKPMKHAMAVMLVFGTSLALAQWSLEGRQVGRESYDRTSIGVHFTLLEGEDAIQAARGCVRSYAEAFNSVTSITCFAYASLEAFEVKSGKVRLCYAVIARWSKQDDVLAFYFAQDDKRYPARCPKP